MASRGLGKGLDSLIPAGINESKEIKQAETIVKIAKVEPNRDQPRKNFDEEIPLNSLVCCSRFLCRTGKNIMR